MVRGITFTLFFLFFCILGASCSAHNPEWVRGGLEPKEFSSAPLDRSERVSPGNSNEGQIDQSLNLRGLGDQADSRRLPSGDSIVSNQPRPVEPSLRETAPQREQARPIAPRHVGDPRIREIEVREDRVRAESPRRFNVGQPRRQPAREGQLVESPTNRRGDDFSHPTISFVDPPQGWLAGGDFVTLRWKGNTTSPHGTSVAIDFSPDGTHWRPVASGLPLVGTVPWGIPRVGTEVGLLRVQVRSARSTVEFASALTEVKIDAVAPSARLFAPTEGSGSSIDLRVEATDRGGSDLRSLELWAYGDGGWQKDSEHSPGNSIQFRPRDTGIHHLWVVAVDHSGLQSASPPIRFSEAFQFEVKSDQGQIRLFSFSDGGIYHSGGRHWVYFQYLGDEASRTVVQLEWSGDDGRTWSQLDSVSAEMNRIEIRLPKQTVPLARIRVVALEPTGRKFEAVSPIPFRVSAFVPEVEVSRIAPTSDGGSAVYFSLGKSAGDAIDQLVLYHLDSSRTRWVRWPVLFDPISPLRVNLPPGSTIELRAIDREGNESPPPHAMALPRPRGSTNSAPAAGPVQWLTRGGRSVAAGTHHYLFWRTETHGADQSLRLEERLGRSGPWRELAGDLPATGRYLWQVPKREGTEVSLRIVTKGPNGDLHTEIPAPFRLDGASPRVSFIGPATSRTPITEFKVGVSEDDPIETIEIWVRRVSTMPWRQLLSAPRGTELSAELADGVYEVMPIAVDLVGNRSDEPSPGGEGQGRLLVDTVVPILEVDGLGERTRLFRRGDTIALRPRCSDANLSAFPISFSLLAGDTTEAVELKRYHPNGVEFAWTLPEQTGMQILEVTAEDLAGNRTVERIVVTIASSPPEPKLLTELGSRVLAAGSDVSLEWESKGVEPDWRGLKIEFSADGIDYVSLEGKFPADGSIAWRVPAVDSNRCTIRLTLTAPDGLLGVVKSGRFTVSSIRPKVRAGGIRPAGGGN